ncbi:MAG: PxKF domain-containing protein [Actinobacteria bacterium]|nr:PxKF domain-containing protein [Actinomycetota bacterium]
MSDKAGNLAAASVGGIRIDRTAPSTSASVPEPLASGWYAGTVLVTLEVAADLSGLEQTFYSVDGGAPQTYSGPFSHGEKGSHTITFWSADKAGNLEDKAAGGNSLTLKIDGVPPRINGSRTPAANSFGWNNDNVAVSFECDDAESGIAGCTDPVTLSSEGADLSVDGSAVDNAGNTASAKVDGINIDLTKPSLTALLPDANAAGWYKGDVSVQWLTGDGLSGIDPATQPANSVVTGEGLSLAAGPVSVSDKAGNSTSASVSGIKIDRTPPQISGGPATQPNASGWYGGDVIVAFTCADNLSGVAACPSDKLISGNGAGQSVTSDSAADLAGNVKAGTTVGGINIDGLPPSTTADNQCTKTNGYCTGTTATVVLTAADQNGLSGVKEIRYSVNGGSQQVAAGTSKSVSVPLDGSGEATVSFYAVDKAGNAEPTNGVALKYDNIAPTVTHTLTPAPNADEWNRSDVTVHFSAKDDDSGSGVDPGSITPDVVVTDEPGKDVLGQALDVAGNKGTDVAKVKLDKTAPAISGAVVSGQLGGNGWYVGPVKVHFTCSDTLSGLAVCPDDVTLTTNGASQSVSGNAYDKAGNKASASVAGISIDQEKPSITSVTPQAGGLYTLGAVPAPSCSAGDDFSGLASCAVVVSGGTAIGAGTFTYTATATDKAGNVSTKTGSYKVAYRFDGFLQPINDTAHQVGTSTSIFKAGSTVPVKFQLKRADGSVVQASSPPLWLNPTKGSLTTAAVDESAYGDAATTGGTYRWDSSAQQYIYNWGTAKAQAGAYWRIGVQLDDGQTYYVNIGLR